MSPMSAGLLAGWLADATPSPSPTMRQFTESDFGVGPGLLSLLTFLLLTIAVVLLWRSMNRQLKRIRPGLDGGPEAPPDTDDPPAPAPSPDGAGSTSQAPPR